MTKHTRGPFLAVQIADIRVGCAAWEVRAVNSENPRRGLRVVSVFGEFCRSRVETKANAELFAAAPDLLEALEEMVDLQQYRTPDDPQCIDEAWCSENDALARARRAILKAKGGIW